MKIIIDLLEKIPVVNNPKTKFETVLGAFILVFTSMIYLAVVVLLTFAAMFSIIFSISYILKFLM